MRIKIIRGIYGHKGKIVEKSQRTEAFEVSGEEAERLISLGVAEKALGDMDIYPELYNEESCKNSGEGGDGFAGNGEETPDVLEDMKMEELQRIAGEMGLKKNGSKKELAERIREFLNQEEDEDVPVLHPAEVE